MVARKSSGDLIAMITITPKNRSPLVTKITMPCWTRFSRASMSDVIRLTSRPVCSLSKKDMERDKRWAKTRLRRSRRNDSPIRLTITIWARSKSAMETDTTR